ncbi:MAG: PilZ domain-containing protein [Gemmatimonadota bacterium]
MKEIDTKPTRSAQRYQLGLPVQLPHGAGLTRDVSTGGVYFQTAQTYHVDSQIDFTLAFGTIEPASPIQVRCHARVVRVEPRSDHIGIAVVITSVVFS